MVWIRTGRQRFLESCGCEKRCAQGRQDFAARESQQRAGTMGESGMFLAHIWPIFRCERLPGRTGLDLSRIYATQQNQRHQRNGIVVRVIEYRLEGIEGAESLYRLAATMLDHEQAPATELAAIFHDRWEIKTAFDELKTHLRGARIVLRSKTRDLARREFYGAVMSHFAVCGLMHEAALNSGGESTLRTK